MTNTDITVTDSSDFPNPYVEITQIPGELEVAYMVGYEPGADDFAILCEQPSMPTRSLTVQQKKNGSDISAHWKGKYSDTQIILGT